LALDDPVISELQVVAVDDCSTDRSLAVLERLASEDGRLEVVRHEQNSGKGDGAYS
jgi:glycosyltransferase involved in cell wall biosynthesis